MFAEGGRGSQVSGVVKGGTHGGKPGSFEDGSQSAPNCRLSGW